MRSLLFTAAALLCAAAAQRPVRADVITAPVALTTPSPNFSYSGLEFQATVNSTLTSFKFVNAGMADTVAFIDSTGIVQDMVTIPAGSPNDVVNVNWALQQGTRYFLYSTTLGNALYGSYGGPTISDGQINLTDTSVFSKAGPPFVSYADNTYWVGFTNITTVSGIVPSGPSGPTSPSATPEPSSVLLAGAGATALLLLRKRRGRL